MNELISRHLQGVLIAGIEVLDGEVNIYRQTSNTRNSRIKLSALVGKIKAVEFMSSFETRSMEVSKWVNSDEFHAPNTSIQGVEPTTITPCDPLRFLGRQVMGVGVYERKQGRGKHLTISLRTAIPPDPEAKKKTTPKIETLVIGITI